jgi:phosphatidylinositol alpha-mannosyltransferase
MGVGRELLGRGAVPSSSRIAMLTPCYWPEVRRGTERIVHELASGMTERGRNVHLITSHPAWPSHGYEGGVEVTRNWRPPDGRIRRRHHEDYLTHGPFSYWSLIRGGHDLAHAFYVTDALVAARWSSRRGRPAIFTYTGIPDRIGLVDRRRRLDLTLQAVAGCRSMTVLSRAAADASRRWLGKEAEVIYPGVDTHAFSPGRARDPAPTIICAGAADEPRKRVGLLVEAFQRLRRSEPEATLLLIRPADAMASQLAAVEGVELLDPVSHPTDLAPAYRRAWVSALPAVGEAFGLVLAEALACGTPVVGSRHGGIPEIISDPGIGRTFDDADGAEGLTIALSQALELARDPTTSALCVQRASEFSIERSLDLYEELYRGLI